MKDFFKYVLATIVGIVILFVGMAILGAMSLVGMVASGEATKNVSDNSVLVVNLSGTMEEQAGDNTLNQFLGSAASTMGLQETLEAIQKAKENDNVKGIYIEAGSFSADYASLQEVRNALLDFKKSGKWIVAYGDIYTQATYYLCSVADKVYLNPSGMIDWHGIGAQPYYVKDVLAKFGVHMQVLKVGKYKSATEMFTEDKMSEANREQTQAYISGLWNQTCADVAASRHITTAALNQYADSLITFADPKNYVRMKLVDKLLYADEVKAEVKKRLALDADQTEAAIKATFKMLNIIENETSL